MADRRVRDYARFMTTAELLSAFDTVMAGVRRTLERLRDDRLGARPHTRSWTTGELATHLTILPGWTHGVLGRDFYDLAPNEGPGAKRAIAHATVADALAAFDTNVAGARAVLAAADPDALAAPWELRRGDRVLRTMTRGEAMRTYVIDHAIHHRGQLTVHLRMHDLPVPALYGSSADEQT